MPLAADHRACCCAPSSSRCRISRVLVVVEMVSTSAMRRIGRAVAGVADSVGMPETSAYAASTAREIDPRGRVHVASATRYFSYASNLSVKHPVSRMTSSP